MNSKIEQLIHTGHGKTHWAHPDADWIWRDYHGICGVRLRGSLSVCISDPEFMFCVDCKSCQKAMKRAGLIK